MASRGLTVFAGDWPRRAQALRDRARAIREHERMLKSKETELSEIKLRAETAERDAKDTWMRAQIQLGKASKEECDAFLAEKQAALDNAIEVRHAARRVWREATAGRRRWREATARRATVARGDGGETAVVRGDGDTDAPL